MSEDLFYKVAYDEAVRALSEQQEGIESLRTRAGMLLSVAAITTSFLGAQALQVDPHSVLAWLALAAFLLMATTSLAILWPRDWDVTANPREVLEALIGAGGPASVAELHRDLSLYMHASYLENRQGLEQLALLFELAGASMAVEVVLWIAAIASGS